MIRTAVRCAANAIGFDVHRFSKAGGRGNYHVDDYYPVDLIPRWGHGKPPHPQITAILNQQREEFLAVLRQLSACCGLLASIPEESTANSVTPFWKNAFFESLDAAALVGMLCAKKPARYVEIGSGNSTKFARYAIEQMHLRTSITSIDPEPRAIINSLCDRVVRRRLEDCDLSFFDQLEPGDFLSFDGTHRVFTNSDATVFYLEVMPRVKPGIIIHVHDIHLPWDYNPDWNTRMYSEQYLLAAMLLCPRPMFKVLLPNDFICHQDPELSIHARAILEPFGQAAFGGSFWMEKI